MFHNPSPIYSWGASRDRGLSQKPGDGQEIGAGVSEPSTQRQNTLTCGHVL